MRIGEERRKTISVVFADIVDSTTLAAELDPEAYRAVLRRWYRAARAVLEAHGGTVEKFIGDAVVGVFGIPQQHEDDAARAVRAAVELGERMGDLNAELEAAHGLQVEIRTGVNTGEAVAGEAEAAQVFATGYAVNVAAKLQQAAPPGGILIGPATYELVRDAVEAEALEPLALGSRGVTLKPYLVRALDRRSSGLARRLDAPLVGREEELAKLRAAFAGAVAEERPRVLTVVGDAGIGKSRLAAELAPRCATRPRSSWAAASRTAKGRPTCRSPRSSPSWPAAGRSLASPRCSRAPSDARLVARRLRQLLGWGQGAPPPGEGFWAVRRLLEAQAAERPLVVVLDDVHWAEPTLLDLVEHLGEHAGAVPLVVLCLARPDVLERRPDWPVAVRLEPLPAERAGQLVDSFGGGAEVSGATRARIVAIAEGNALFLEQLLAHVLERGEVRARGHACFGREPACQPPRPPGGERARGARARRGRRAHVLARRRRDAVRARRRRRARDARVERADPPGALRPAQARGRIASTTSSSEMWRTGRSRRSAARGSTSRPRRGSPSATRPPTRSSATTSSSRTATDPR